MIVVAYVTGLFQLRQRVIVQLRLLMLNYFVERAFWTKLLPTANTNFLA